MYWPVSTNTTKSSRPKIRWKRFKLSSHSHSTWGRATAPKAQSHNALLVLTVNDAQPLRSRRQETPKEHRARETRRPSLCLLVPLDSLRQSLLHAGQRIQRQREVIRMKRLDGDNPFAQINRRLTKRDCRLP